MTDTRAERRLAALPLFAALDPAELATLLNALVKRVQVRKGALLYLQGEYDRHAYLLDRGAARLLRVGSDGAERVLRELQPGELVGQGALFLGESRDVSLEVTGDATFFVIDGLAFNDFSSHHPDIAARLVPRAEVQRKRDALRLRWQRADEALLYRRPLAGWTLTTRRLVRQDLLGRRQVILRHIADVRAGHARPFGRRLDRGRVVVSLEGGGRMVWRAVLQPHKLADLIFVQVGRDRARAQAEAVARARRALGGVLPPEAPAPQPDTLADDQTQWLVPDLRRLADWFARRLLTESAESQSSD